MNTKITENRVMSSWPNTGVFLESSLLVLVFAASDPSSYGAPFYSVILAGMFFFLGMAGVVTLHTFMSFSDTYHTSRHAESLFRILCSTDEDASSKAEDSIKKLCAIFAPRGEVDSFLSFDFSEEIYKSSFHLFSSFVLLAASSCIAYFALDSWAVAAICLPLFLFRYLSCKLYAMCLGFSSRIRDVSKYAYDGVHLMR